jgi:hypothetical protein
MKLEMVARKEKYRRSSEMAEATYISEVSAFLRSYFPVPEVAGPELLHKTPNFIASRGLSL